MRRETMEPGSEFGEKQEESRCIFKIESIEWDGLHMGCERKKTMKDDIKVMSKIIYVKNLELFPEYNDHSVNYTIMFSLTPLLLV